MALRNGVLVVGPSRWAVAVRDQHGEVVVRGGPRPTSGEVLLARVPLLRGPVHLVNMLRVLRRALRSAPQARLVASTPPMLAAIGTGALLGSALLHRSRSQARGELLSGVVVLASTLAALRSGELAHYHGAEHKAIAGYELGIAPSDAPRVHPRCGTQLALPMLVLSSIATRGALLLMPGHPRAARAAGQAAGLAMSTELLRRAATRGSRGLIVRVGHWLQREITTADPSPDQLAVAVAARDAVLEREPAAQSRW